MTRWLALVLSILASWWALYAWHPQDEPPAWAAFGPFETKEECEWVGGRLNLPASFEFVRCAGPDQLP